MSDLDVLDPPGVSVTFRGERLDVRPLTLGKLPKLVRLARPALEVLLTVDEGESIGAGTLLGVIGDHGEEVIAGLAVLIDRDVEWVGGAALSDTFDLLAAQVAVNRDFFVQTLAPLLVGRAGPVTTGDGPTASSSSSSGGTA